MSKLTFFVNSNLAHVFLKKKSLNEKLFCVADYIAIIKTNTSKL